VLRACIRNTVKCDFLVNEDFAACLLDRVTELSLFRAKRFAETGADIIKLGDDVGGR
jgi:uroporphyrinogen-III decarboxylase